MARRRAASTDTAGEGGALAHRNSSLGLQQRTGILQAKAADPLLDAQALADRFMVSREAVQGLLNAITMDMQPVLRSYAPEAAEAYLTAMQMAALKGNHTAARDMLIDGGAIPDRAKAGGGLNVTVVVSAPPGTPQYSVTSAPEPLVLDIQAGPQAQLTALPASES